MRSLCLGVKITKLTLWPFACSSYASLQLACTIVTSYQSWERPRNLWFHFQSNRLPINVIKLIQQISISLVIRNRHQLLLKNWIKMTNIPKSNKRWWLKRRILKRWLPATVQCLLTMIRDPWLKLLTRWWIQNNRLIARWICKKLGNWDHIKHRWHKKVNMIDY